MKRMIFIAIFMMMISGCAPDTQPSDTVRLMPTSTPNTTDTAQIVNLSLNDIALALPYPSTWESYTTEYGVVLAEYLGSVATEGQLGGILIHLFVPPLDEMNIPISESDNNNRALDILSKILAYPDYVGNATVSTPSPFLWDQFECAYYLMDNGEGNLTIVIGILDPQTNRLVTVSMSAPQDQQTRIRAMLPVLLDGLVINDYTLSGMVLDDILPNPLVFPRHNRTS